MMTTDSPKQMPTLQTPSKLTSWLLLTLLFLAVQMASLFTPPLLDDADAAHAQISQHMVETGDMVTPHVNGIRYLEKPPLPYWIVAGLYLVGGENTFTTHLPNALSMLGLAWLAWLWARRAWGNRAGLYAALALLTAIGPFLFTRFIIPEAMLSFLLLAALYCLLTGLEDNHSNRFYFMWALLALALLTKGLIAPVFFFAAAIPFLLLTGQWRRWRLLKPFTGILLFLAIAAPWHILAGLANPNQGHPLGNHPTIGNVHGFWYFYFINEHVLRFLSLRYPRDYNKVPGIFYWLQHLAWLFPWSLFLPALIALAWKTRKNWLQHLRHDAGQTVDFYLDNAVREDVATYVQHLKFRVRTIWLLSIFSAFILLFFSLSSNQEYYTFPAWTPLFILIAGVLSSIEKAPSGEQKPLLSTAWLTGAQTVYAIIGILASVALFWGLWSSRNLPFVPDIGTVLAHRGVGNYTLSMSHLFDLTGTSFAALRLPAALAAVAMLLGPVISLLLRLKKKHLAATVVLAITSAVFLVAAHIAFSRFEPILSSKQIADTIQQKGSPTDTLIIYGDQSDASSVIYYTHSFFKDRPAEIVMPRCGQHNEGSTMLWGSCYPDAPDIFVNNERLAQEWGTGERKWLFAQDINQDKAQQLLGERLYLVQILADKALWTDRPL